MKYSKYLKMVPPLASFTAGLGLFAMGLTTGSPLWLIGGSMGVIWSSSKLNAIFKQLIQSYLLEKNIEQAKQEISAVLEANFNEAIVSYCTALGQGKRTPGMRLKDHLVATIQRGYSEIELADDNPAANSHAVNLVTLDLVTQYKQRTRERTLHPSVTQKEAQNELSHELANWVTEDIQRRKVHEYHSYPR